MSFDKFAVGLAIGLIVFGAFYVAEAAASFAYDYFNGGSWPHYLVWAVCRSLRMLGGLLGIIIGTIYLSYV